MAEFVSNGVCSERRVRTVVLKKKMKSVKKNSSFILCFDYPGLLTLKITEKARHFYFQMSFLS